MPTGGAPVESPTTEIQAHGGNSVSQMNIDPQMGVLALHLWTLQALVPHPIDDRILGLLGPKAGVSNRPGSSQGTSDTPA